MKNIPSIRYADFVAQLVKPGKDILTSATPEKLNMWHSATGISGEAGELLDAVKKYVIYNKPLDRENIIEELGDLEFYMEQMRQAIDIDREDVIYSNMFKLSERYKSLTYSDQAANDRADKEE